MELDNTETKGIKYRVEDDAGNYNGYSGTERGAAEMAESAADLAPADAPYHVRQVPEDEVHFDADGSSVGDIVYTTLEEYDRDGET